MNKLVSLFLENHTIVSRIYINYDKIDTSIGQSLTCYSLIYCANKRKQTIIHSSFRDFFNPIVIGLFDSPILVGGGGKTFSFCVVKKSGNIDQNQENCNRIEFGARLPSKHSTCDRMH